jgi:hypothetical protein
MHGTQTSSAAVAIHALAERHKVVYTQTTTDAWAQHITRLAGKTEHRPTPIKLSAEALFFRAPERR